MMSGLHGRNARDEAAPAVSGRGHSELPAEGAAEHFVAPETAGKRNPEHGILAGEEQDRGPREPQPQDQLPGGLTSRGGKAAMQVKWREPRPAGERFEREVFAEMGSRECQDRLQVFERPRHVLRL